MLGTALLIAAGLLIVGLSILSMNSSLELRLSRATREADDIDPARAEALRHITRDIEKGNAGGLY